MHHRARTLRPTEPAQRAMDQSERIARIDTLLRSRGELARHEIQRQFAVSRATFQRDLAFLRERLGSRVVYDAAKDLYRYEAKGAPKAGRHDQVPGVWLKADEARALLALLNVMRQIDPGFLSTLLAPLRGALKKLPPEQRERRSRLDEKIEIAVLQGHTPGPDAREVLRALASDEPIELQWPDRGGQYRRAVCVVRKLRLDRSGGWKVLLEPEGGRGVWVRLEGVIVPGGH
jgi:predicted DNA-binding transcriptional regulator YafY